MDRFNPETLEAWLAHPLTEVFRQYLRDRRDSLGRLWMRGHPMGPECQVQARLLGDLLDLSFEDYDSFYGLTEETAPQ